MCDRVINMGLKRDTRIFIHSHTGAGRCSRFQAERELADYPQWGTQPQIQCGHENVPQALQCQQDYCRGPRMVSEDCVDMLTSY